MGEKAVKQGKNQTELQLSKAASCWLFVYMQVKVDVLCHFLSQWPNNASSLKQALVWLLYYKGPRSR